MSVVDLLFNCGPESLNKICETRIRTLINGIQGLMAQGVRQEGLPMDKANILAIGAHPDDIEFGCGGALIKYTRKGHRLFLLVMTGGGHGRFDVNVRMKEQEDSKEILGAEKFTGAAMKTPI